MNYKKGLVLGKFMPLHKGHLALIEYAAKHCDLLYVLLCVHEGEVISGTQRLQWFSDVLENKRGIQPVLFQYNPDELTNSSVSSEEESAKWAYALRTHFPDVEVFFSSEDYGDLLAKYWPCKHEVFDKARLIVPVSGTVIREHPFQYWEYLPREVQPYFVKQIVLSGTESTGKTMLAQKLAEHFKTEYVHEAGREIVAHTTECKPEHLEQIATAHAYGIERKRRIANRILFLDTDINITRSYSKFLFKQELDVAEWIEQSNRSHLYLFLENDVPFVQDGTRLEEDMRNELHESHRNELQNRGIDFISIRGNWEERFEQAKRIVESLVW